MLQCNFDIKGDSCSVDMKMPIILGYVLYNENAITSSFGYVSYSENAIISS